MTPPTTDHPTQPPLGGRYLLGSVLGRGGMATVWRARDLSGGTHVAVKIAGSDEANRRFRIRLANEAATLRRLAHPNVVALRDVGRDGKTGVVFLVMELAHRGTLAQTAAEHRLSPQAAATWGVQVLAALSSVHAAGIVHRDIKPSNILLDIAGNALLADFGVARTPADEFEDNYIVGTPTFTAPEQLLEPARTHPASDLYALGATLYAVLTRRSPKDLHRVPWKDPRWEALPREVRQTIFQSTRARPCDRFANAAAMAALLAPYVPSQIWARQRHLGAWLGECVS